MLSDDAKITFASKYAKLYASYGFLLHGYTVEYEGNVSEIRVGQRVNDVLQKVLTEVPKTITIKDWRLLMDEVSFDIIDEATGKPVETQEVKAESPVLYKQYKLRRKSDGLYSTGGSCPSFNKKGKVWTSLAALSGHLGQQKGDTYSGQSVWNQYSYGFHTSGGDTWDDLEIVTLEIRENETEKLEASGYMKGLRERQKKREDQLKARRARSEMEAAQKRYDQAKKVMEDFQTRYGG